MRFRGRNGSTTRNVNGTDLRWKVSPEQSAT